MAIDPLKKDSGISKKSKADGLCAESCKSFEIGCNFLTLGIVAIVVLGIFLSMAVAFVAKLTWDIPIIGKFEMIGRDNVSLSTVLSAFGFALLIILAVVSIVKIRQ